MVLLPQKFITGNPNVMADAIPPLHKLHQDKELCYLPNDIDDEAILTQAKELGAFVVSNDRYKQYVQSGLVTPAWLQKNCLAFYIMETGPPWAASVETPAVPRQPHALTPILSPKMPLSSTLDSLGGKPGFVFVCRSSTQAECLQQRLFGLPKGWRDPSIWELQPGSPVLLYNQQCNQLLGVFRAETALTENLDPLAWGGRYPLQVRVSVSSVDSPYKSVNLHPDKHLSWLKSDGVLKYMGKKVEASVFKMLVRDILQLDVASYTDTCTRASDVATTHEASAAPSRSIAPCLTKRATLSFKTGLNHKVW